MKPVTSQAVVDAGACPLCRRPNHCQLCTSAAYKGPCWCMTLNIPDELLARVPVELRNKTCICEACVKTFQVKPTRVKAPPHPALSPDGGEGKDSNRDFYFDTSGLMVFTKAYHLRRGYCCGSGCRHCPYPATT